MSQLKRCMFDNNVVIDLINQRQEFLKEAKILFAWAEKQKIQGVLCADSLTNIYYVVKKLMDRQTAEHAIEMLLKTFDIAPVDKSILQNAQRMKAKDFEDAVIIASAEQYQVEAIITRNVKDFKSANVPVYTPAEAVIWLRNYTH